MSNSSYVLCVTLNPCLDKTLTVPEWAPGDNVRGTAVREVVGGKGNNVARALKGLGRSSRPATFLGGATGRRCEELLRRQDGFEPLVIPSRAETRTILTVRTGESAEQTAFFDPDPSITTDEAIEFVRTIAKEIDSGRVDALTLSGSSPSTATHAVFADCIAKARTAGVPVFLDTYGNALQQAAERAPDVIQLNRKEIAGALGLSQNELTAKQIRNWLAERIARGTRLAVVTQGSDPVFAASQEGFWAAAPPKIEPVNPIGSGDSMLAGLCHAWLSGESAVDALRFAVACGVANALVWVAGAIDFGSVRHVLSQVVVARAEDALDSIDEVLVT